MTAAPVAAAMAAVVPGGRSRLARRLRPGLGAVCGTVVVLGVLLMLLVDPGQGRPPVGPWEPPPLPVTVGYASWRDDCRHDPGPDESSACSGWRLVVRSGESVEGAEPVEGNGALRSIEISDAAMWITLPDGPALRPPLRVTPDGHRIAYFSTAERRFVAHDLPSGRKVGLASPSLDDVSEGERLDLHVSADGRFFAAARLGGRPQVRLTDFETGATTTLDGVCEILNLGRDARRIIGVPCSGDPPDAEDGPYERYGNRSWTVFDRDGTRIGNASEHAFLTGVSSDVGRGTALVSADGGRTAGLYRDAFRGARYPGGDERLPEPPDILAVRGLESGRVLRLVRLPEVSPGWGYHGVVGDRVVLRSPRDDVYLMVDLTDGGIHRVLDAPPDDPSAVFGAPATSPATGPPAPSGRPLAAAPPSGVVSGCTGDPCERWHLATDAVPDPPLPGALAVPSLFAVSRDGRHLAYGREEDLSLVVHDLETGRVLSASGPLDPDIGTAEKRPRLFFTPDGRRLLFQPWEGRPVETVDPRTGRRSRFRVGPGDSLVGWTSTGPVVHRVTIGEDGPYESELRFLSPGGKRLRTVRTDDWPGAPPSGVSPDGSRAVAPGDGDAPLIIDIPTGREVRADVTRYGGWRHWVFQDWITPDEVLLRTEPGAVREYGVLTFSTGEIRYLP
ncbi:hypothetical protein GCM10010466_28570 [Planomonospora alba]|uniref:WD40 repeat protein n=1 Tax=Planomonospora alba TaxID=161354 RepID=A0ABP6N6L9_9ACTN